MADERYRSRRLVLRNGVGEDRVAALGRAHGWRFRGEAAPDPQGEVAREVIWEIESGLNLHYFEDSVSRCECVVVSGADPALIERTTGFVEEALDTWRGPELLTAVDAATDPVERARAVIRLGLGAPSDFDPEASQRIRDAMHDDDPRVREAGLWATAYPAWDEFRSLIDRMAREDSSEELRDQAHDILRAFDLEKGIEPF